MRKLDSAGSKLCSYQADIFSASIEELDCSSAVFLRRFYHSSFAAKLDDFRNHLFSFDVKDCFLQIDEEYGKSSYGNKKLSEPVLHWLGYITRYICYTRDVSSKKFIKSFDLKLFIDNYEVYHTQSEEWVVERILELSGMNQDFFDKKIQARNVLKKIWLL